MSEKEEVSDETFWKGSLRKHKNALIIMIIAGICLFIGAILVGIWVLEANPFVDPRIGTFNDWTLNYVVGFIILIILWELLFIGVPAALFFGVGGYLWWNGLPEEEKKEFKEREKKKKSRKAEKWGGGGGGFSFFMFIAYCIYIAVDGNYNTIFGLKSYTYWLYSYMLTFMWIFIVLGVPVAIILLIVYLTKWRKK
jgi:MFS family permease